MFSTKRALVFFILRCSEPFQETDKVQHLFQI